MKNTVTFENAKGQKQVIEVYDFCELSLKVQNGELVLVKRLENIKPKGSQK
ncbi:hypothetical protein [Vagococcus luciliae]|uniref:Uncharacterized protein n=1 Tax=Vagococcus luciliae TaxID=2920380 RepID=A0ABY5P1R5_9ENTE|nr:hypothetical protein [Vagococcus luciliae]UUV99578.1 hypothetical protein G314FT_17390 [Vagococcus luciliae]